MRKYRYDKESHFSRCEIRAKNKSYIGIAFCNPEDYDFENEFTGKFIAEVRAEISKAKDELVSIKEQFKAIKHLYLGAMQSKKFDPKCYSSKAMKREYYRLKTLCEEYVQNIKECEETLSIYLKEKDKFYRLTKKNRKKDLGENN